MKVRSGIACVISAVSAVSFAGVAQAVDLRWDADGPGGAFGANGSGVWDLDTANWNDTPETTNLTWIQGSNAVFGAPVASIAINTTTHTISLGADLVVNDIQLNPDADGGHYSFDAPGGNSLTVNGNIIKNSFGGPVLFDLLTGPFNFGAGDHVIALRDTPGGATPEMAINANIHGAGGFTLDNRLTLDGPKEAWGILTLTGINDYAGATNIKFGRLNISQSSGLGTSAGLADGTIISEAGTLSIGGAGTGTLPGAVTLSEAITITRNTYTGDEFGRYRAAVISENGVGKTTINGPFVVDSNDARVGAYTSTLEIASNITVGVNATLPMLSVTGDFAGFVHLTGNNTALTGGVSIIDQVQLDVDNDNQIGGASAPLNFVGGGTYHPVNGYATSFGSHVVNRTTFNGGISVDADKTFTIDQQLGPVPIINPDLTVDYGAAVGSLGKRGTGTMNINSVVNLRGGQTYWDAGTVNINAEVRLANLHLRSAIVNIPTGASITTINGYSSFGESSTGTNGGPDIAVMNITGGKFIQNQNEDLNISDLANTRGTVNLSAGELFTNGLVFVGRNSGAIGEINQSGGKFTVNRDGNFALVLGDGRDGRTPVGNYNFTGGTLRAEGEAYVGEGRTGTGNWNQSGSGTVAELDHWFVVGREGGQGTVNLTNGASIIKTRGGTHVEIDAGSFNNLATPSVMTVDNATFNIINGELRIGTGGGSDGTLNIKNGATVTANSWIGLGRDNGKGVINLDGGILTKQGGDNVSIGWKANSNGTLNVNGGTFNVTTGETWISEGGIALINVTAGAMNVGRLDVGRGSEAATGFEGTGELRISNGAVSANDIFVGSGGRVVGTINLSGGSLTANSIQAGGSTGAKTVNFTGGTLAANAITMPAGLNNSGTGVLSPGVIVTTTPTLSVVPGVGTLTIANGYTQAATAALKIELASTGNDLVTVSSGAASLAGPVNLSLLGGYVPNLYTPVSLVTAPSVTGIFSSVTGLIASPTRRLAVTYTGTTVLVQAARPGDANLDGSVEFQDLVSLAQGYNLSGKSWVNGDFTGDGTVEFQDLVVLAQFYNSPATFQSDWAFAQSLAPEPTSLMVLGFAGLLSMRKRSR